MSMNAGSLRKRKGSKGDKNKEKLPTKQQCVGTLSRVPRLRVARGPGRVHLHGAMFIFINTCCSS